MFIMKLSIVLLNLSYDAGEIKELDSKLASNATHRFKQADPLHIANVKSGGQRKSRHAELWAIHAFDEWRRFKGVSTEESIADLSEKEEIRHLVELLTIFFLEIKKTDGSLYPPQR